MHPACSAGVLPVPPRPAGRGGARGRTTGWLAAGLCLAATLFPGSVGAQALMSQDDALASAFPEADTFDRRTAFLTDEDAAAVEAITGETLDQRVVTYYVAQRSGRALGAAYFDVHRVRTLREVLMVALDGQGAVKRLEVLSFAEPREYLAPEAWMALFQGRAEPDAGALRREIPNMTGATLTSNAVKDAVARVLAIHRVVASGEGSGR